MKSTLAVKHYHIIFTVPHELNQIYLWDRRLYCNILFRAASRTLHSFGYTHYGCETGAVAVLHIPLGGTGSGGKTFLCIRICTALFRQPVIPCRGNGAISANMIIIVQMLKNGETVPRVALPKTSKTDLKSIKGGCRPSGM